MPLSKEEFNKYQQQRRARIAEEKAQAKAQAEQEALAEQERQEKAAAQAEQEALAEQERQEKAAAEAEKQRKQKAAARKRKYRNKMAKKNSKQIAKAGSLPTMAGFSLVARPQTDLVVTTVGPQGELTMDFSSCAPEDRADLMVFQRTQQGNERALMNCMQVAKQAMDDCIQANGSAQDKFVESTTTKARLYKEAAADNRAAAELNFQVELKKHTEGTSTMPQPKSAKKVSWIPSMGSFFSSAKKAEDSDDEFVDAEERLSDTEGTTEEPPKTPTPPKKKSPIAKVFERVMTRSAKKEQAMRQPNFEG